MVRKKVSTENSLVPCMTKKGTRDKGTKVIFKMNEISINKNMHLSGGYENECENGGWKHSQPCGD